METLAKLRSLIIRAGAWALPAAAPALTEALLERYGACVQAVLLYGSCYRTGDDRESLVDLYVLVDRYRTVGRRRGAVLANRLLPPNVYSLALSVEGRPVRAKYAVLTLADLERRTGPRAFLPYFWGRFAQPVALLYARTDEARRRVEAALAQAVVTFVTRVLPLLPPRFDAERLWRHGLALSYGTELRSERRESIGRLFRAWSAHYEAITEAALAAGSLPAVPVGGAPTVYQADIPRRRRVGGRLAWGLRSGLGKGLSVLRLVKALFTFQGGPEYILWKIQRHSGVAIELSARARRHPLLAGWVVLWRLYRRGAFR